MGKPYNDEGYPLTALRVSALGDAISCPHRYKVLHMDRQERSQDVDYFAVGHCVHEALEDSLVDPIYNDLSIDEETQKKALVKLYKSKWVHHFDQALLDALEEYEKEYVSCIQATNDYADSIGKVYKAHEQTKFWKDNCVPRLIKYEAAVINITDPYEVNGRTISRRYNMVLHKPLQSLYEQGLRCVANYVTINREFIELHGIPEKTVAEFHIKPDVPNPLSNKLPPLTGTIDRLDFFSDGRFYVTDYKTGKKVWDETSVRNSDQFNQYAYCASKKFSQPVTHIGVWDLLAGKLNLYVNTTQDESRWLARLKGNCRYVEVIHSLASEAKATSKGQDFCSSLFLPVPAGLSFKLHTACDNCPLPYETDPEKKCPYFEIY